MEMTDLSDRPPGPTVTFPINTDANKARPQFADQIRQFAARKAETNVFSGEHFEVLSEFLNGKPRAAAPCNTQPPRSTLCSPAAAPGILAPPGPSAGPGPAPAPELPPMYLVRNRDNARRNNAPNTVASNSGGGEIGDESTQSRFSPVLPSVAVNAGDNLEITLAQSTPGPNSSLLIFLRGWQSPAWLRILGAQCGIDPEMLRRHLAFLSARSFFDQPPPPSHQLGIWRIRVVTISICDSTHDALNPEEVQSRRQTSARDVRKYLHKLKATSQVGSSILRRYSAIDGTTSVIEQDVSFYATMKKAGGWIGTIWMDSGSPFECSRILEHKTRAGVPARDRQERYVPLVLHRPKIAISQPEPPPAPSGWSPAASTTPPPTTAPCPNLFNLPIQYGSTLDPDLARIDAFYTFSELISVAASSENQLLNLLKERIDVGLHAVEDSSLANLQYLTTLLQGVIERAKEAVYLVENEAYNKWPTATQQQQQVQARETARKLLLDDYRFILRRAQSITATVREGIAAITTDVTMRDAQRSIRQGRRVGHITVLAYFFLPLSFVTSIYGMNFVDFGDAPWKGVAAFVGTLVGVFIPSMLLCFWHKTPWAAANRKGAE